MERLESNADLAELANVTILAYQQCAAKVDALRAFYETEIQQEKEP